MAIPLLRASYRDRQQLLTKANGQRSAILLDECNIDPGHRQPKVHALANAGKIDDHPLIALHGRRPCPTAHSDPGRRFDVFPFEVRQPVQMINVAYAGRLFDPHGHHVEATNFKSML